MTARTDELALYQKALAEFGLSAQAGMLMEECGELIAATHRFLRGRTPLTDLVEELVDVQLMLNQVRLALHAEGDWQRWKACKLARLRLLLSQGEG